MKTEREWRERRPDGWDQTDTHLLRRFYSTLPIDEVCWLLERSKLAIFNRAHVLGVLGYFDNEEDAAQAYRGAAVQLPGEFARW